MSLIFDQGQIVILYNNQHETQVDPIIYIFIKTSNYYTIRYKSPSDYDQVSESYLMSLNILQIILIDRKIAHHIYKWIKHDSKITLYLHNITKEAKQGYFLINIGGK